MKLNVLYQSSDLYAPIAGVAVTSLLENNKHFEEINIYFLDDGISSENKRKFISLVNDYGRKICFLDTTRITQMLQSLNVAKWRNTYTIYFKLFASALLPESIDSILYLDSDTVVDGPLDELAQTDLSNAPCAMVLAPNYNKHKTFIGIPEDSFYFEAGTIFFNLEYWRHHDAENEIINYIKDASSKYYAADQDILNVLYSDRIKKLNLKYGVCTGIYLYSAKQLCRIYDLNEKVFYSFDEIESAKVSPFICHFSGGGINGRPWEVDNKEAKVSMWDKYLYLSPWKDWKKIKSNKSRYLKIQQMFYKIMPSVIYALFHRMALHLYFKRKVAALVKERQNQT
jgi:Lipopolysaccharide biosynthesis proteins, LPS:glycosyltransferases